MRSLFRPVTLAVVAACIAGCGGGSFARLPSSDHVVRPQLNGGSANTGVLPTLYVSGQGAVYAYDLPAPGQGGVPNPNPVDTASGYYFQSPDGGVTSSIAGIATNSIGDLVIVENFANPTFEGNSCQLVYIPARKGSTTASPSSSGCVITAWHNTVTGIAVGVTFTGPPTGTASSGPYAFNDDIDVLMHYMSGPSGAYKNCAGNTQDSFEVDKYQVSSGDSIAPQGCVVLAEGMSAFYHAIAGSTNGAFFVDYAPIFGPSGNVVERYDASPAVTSSATTPGTAGALAVSVNAMTNVGYRVVASTNGGVTTIYSFKVAGNGLTFTHALGSFNNPVAALAVDNNGNIYVGINQPGGVTKVKVYGPTQTQATNPDYILNNPVRRGNPAAHDNVPAARITGLAIAQSP